MKTFIQLIFILPLVACGQEGTQESSVETQKQIPMSETYQRASDGVGNRYYEEGSDVPFTGILYGRYDNGELMTTQEYVDGIGNGTWTSYDPDGRKYEEGTYVDNRVEGPVVLYYEDGSVKARGQYRHWKQPIGKWTYYDRSGSVVHTMVYTP